MKAKTVFGLIVILVLVVSSISAQEFTLTTTKENLVASKATIEMPGLSGNPSAIIVATPVGDTEKLNRHAIGAWYYNDKWNIFNTDHATMPQGLTFKLQVFLKAGANQFLHVITKGNLSDEGSYIDNPALNNNPNAQFKILQNYAPEYRSPYNLNPFEVKTVYNSASGKWYIANVNGKSLFQNQNAAYNIVISSNGKDDSKTLLSAPTQLPLSVTTPKPTTPIVRETITASTTAPCTQEIAYQKIGKWGKQQKDDLAMADRNFPKEQYKPVLAKAQRVIELFKQANPEFKGIEGYAKRSIRGESDIPNGALPFSIEVGYKSYVCAGNDYYIADARGKAILQGGYGYTTVEFNSLRDVLGRVIEDKPLLTNDGEEIFEFNKQLGEFEGFALIEPIVRDQAKHEVIIITPDKRLPYKPITREKYLQARIKFYQGQTGNHTSEIASLISAIENMSPAERQAPAIVRDIFALPGRVKLFATEVEGGRHLVTIDKSFFNPKLPRNAIQFITVHWSWSSKESPPLETIRQLKQNFDYEALRQMLGK